MASYKNYSCSMNLQKSVHDKKKKSILGNKCKIAQMTGDGKDIKVPIVTILLVQKVEKYKLLIRRKMENIFENPNQTYRHEKHIV